MQDLNDKVTGNQLTAAEWNQPASELQNVIVQSGQTLSGADLQQLLKSFNILAGVDNIYSATFSAGNLGCSIYPPAQVPVTLNDGYTFFVYITTSIGLINNPTMSVGAFTKDLRRRDGSVLDIGMITHPSFIRVQYDAGNDRFFIVENEDGKGVGPVLKCDRQDIESVNTLANRDGRVVSVDQYKEVRKKRVVVGTFNVPDNATTQITDFDFTRDVNSGDTGRVKLTYMFSTEEISGDGTTDDVVLTLNFASTGGGEKIRILTKCTFNSGSSTDATQHVRQVGIDSGGGAQNLEIYRDQSSGDNRTWIIEAVLVGLSSSVTLSIENNSGLAGSLYNGILIAESFSDAT